MSLIALKFGRSSLVFGLLVLGSILGCNNEKEYRPHNGDIIFQTSTSPQSLAIQHATNSQHSHMGLIFIRDGATLVFEAVQPVKLTPLAEWIARGEGKHFTIKRLVNAESLLTPEVQLKMLELGKAQFLGKDYDPYFLWSSDSLYCSELVWKIYDQALGIKIGRLRKLGDFNISHPVVAAKLEKRFGGSPPLDEDVISPGDMFDCELLFTVYTR